MELGKDSDGAREGLRWSSGRTRMENSRGAGVLPTGAGSLPTGAGVLPSTIRVFPGTPAPSTRIEPPAPPHTPERAQVRASGRRGRGRRRGGVLGRAGRGRGCEQRTRGQFGAKLAWGRVRAGHGSVRPRSGRAGPGWPPPAVTCMVKGRAQCAPSSDVDAGAFRAAPRVCRAAVYIRLRGPPGGRGQRESGPLLATVPA
jgi:hypothetical protein